MSDKTTLQVTDPSGAPANWHSVLPAKRKTVIAYPGQISKHTSQGQVGGCRLVVFGHGYVKGLQPADDAELQSQIEADGVTSSSVDQLNTYFKYRENLFIVDSYVVPPGIIYVYISTTLDAKDMDDFHIAGAYTAVTMQAYRGEATLEELDESYNEVRVLVLEKAKERDEEAANKAKEEAEAAEKARLQEVGRLAEARGWEGRIEKLEGELSRLSAKLKAEKSEGDANAAD
jgi:hypothetical protein